MKILCYGDSNTYGYDPRAFLSDRYPEDYCWTSLLEQAGYSVLNRGMNGREIPRRPAEIRAAVQMFAAEQPDYLIIMLGSNDLLMNPLYTAENVLDRMSTFLDAVQIALPKLPVLLVAPVPMVPGAWVQEDRLLRESNRLAEVYEALAFRTGAAFADAADWGVELIFDGVHFSEQGHRSFAVGLQRWLLEHNYI